MKAIVQSSMQTEFNPIKTPFILKRKIEQHKPLKKEMHFLKNGKTLPLVSEQTSSWYTYYIYSTDIWFILHWHVLTSFIWFEMDIKYDL